MKEHYVVSKGAGSCSTSLAVLPSWAAVIKQCCWPGVNFLLTHPSGILAPADLTKSCDAARESQKQDGANQLMGCTMLSRE